MLGLQGARDRPLINAPISLHADDPTFGDWFIADELAATRLTESKAYEEGLPERSAIPVIHFERATRKSR